MFQTPPHVKKFKSAHSRFLKPTLERFFMQEFPRYFGPKIAERIADEVISIFQKLNPSKQTLQPGQIFWNALHKNTRADSRNVKFVPVILTIVDQEDIRRYVSGVKQSVIARDSLARMIKQAYSQGGILSSRDLALLTLRNDSRISTMRIRYEKEHNVVLPHTGALHDMGTCLTHKEQIIYKVVIQKKDPALVASETNHSQKSVDNYLQNYNRVKTVYNTNTDINHIHFVTKIAKHVIKQYIKIYELYESQDVS